jgi:hypothetical protein
MQKQSFVIHAARALGKVADFFGFQRKAGGNVQLRKKKSKQDRLTYIPSGGPRRENTDATKKGNAKGAFGSGPSLCCAGPRIELKTKPGECECGNRFRTMKKNKSANLRRIACRVCGLRKDVAL